MDAVMASTNLGPYGSISVTNTEEVAIPLPLDVPVSAVSVPVALPIQSFMIPSVSEMARDIPSEALPSTDAVTSPGSIGPNESPFTTSTDEVTVDVNEISSVSVVALEGTTVNNTLIPDDSSGIKANNDDGATTIVETECVPSEAQDQCVTGEDNEIDNTCADTVPNESNNAETGAAVDGVIKDADIKEEDVAEEKKHQTRSSPQKRRTLRKKKKEPVQTIFPCHECTKVFKTQYYLNMHLRKKNKYRPYGCSECGKRFRHRYVLTNHIRTHTGEKPYKCYNCDLTFGTSQYRNLHYKKCIQGLIPPKKEKVKSEPKKRVKQPVLCHVCNKMFSSDQSLKVHFRTHTGLKPFACPHCPKTFAQKASLQTHVRSHTGEKPFICGQCGKCLTQKSGLENHMRTHTAVKPYTCEICGKSFAVSSNLRSHIRVHSGDKPYTCPVCNKAFSTSSTCNKHYRRSCGGTTTVHQAREAARALLEPPVQIPIEQTIAMMQQTTEEILANEPKIDTPDNKCTECGKQFRSKQHLQIHFRTHTGLKPYQCPHCPKKFAQSGSLQSHIRVHTGEKPFECPTCRRGFTQNSDLKKHMRTHTSDKPYHCDICDKSFSISSNFKVHLRTHSGDKPYNCNTCDKAFTTSSGLKKHLKRCSKPTPEVNILEPQQMAPSPVIGDQGLNRLSHPETMSQYSDTTRDFNDVRPELVNSGIPDFHTSDAYWSKTTYLQYMQHDAIARQSQEMLTRQSEDMLRQSQDLLSRQSQDILSRQSQAAQDLLSRQSQDFLARQSQELLNRQTQDILSRASQELLARPPQPQDLLVRQSQDMLAVSRSFEDSSSYAHWR